MRALLLLPLLALAACKDKPKPVTKAGYTFTVAGWDVSSEKKKHLESVKFEAFSEDVACMFQAFEAGEDITPEALQKEYLEQFKGKNPSPAQLDTALGSFSGQTFDGEIPSDNVTGKVAQLAGVPHVELLTLRDGNRLLAFLVTRFGDNPDGKKSAERCLKMLATIVPAKS